ncbi:hypothetical protein COV61_00375 [Candidatus Micrarchaeota archaeon CG11_big_fil_rev_8_21_14_0_20_47_5]|nr:MAG: hypothetical protein AUJ17_00920 [Candidatus Micrarchaeota archaeon CG1_02_47_40]PIN84350.1 MAG: hypothetical protein COV61_00375 [Candidatus Micrarchaeota archaeon CG11_big_fil_rev_8_21_14_0_20_47_5]
MIVEEPNKENTSHKSPYTSYQHQENKVIRYKDDETAQNAFRIISDLTVKIIEASSSRISGRKTFNLDARYVQSVIDNLTVKTAVNQLSEEDIKKELHKFLNDCIEYKFFFRIRGISMKSKKISFDKATFWEDITALKQDYDERSLLFLGKDEEGIILQISISASNDQDVAFHMACDSAKFYIGCLTFLGFYKFSALDIGVRISLNFDFLPYSIQYSYLTNGQPRGNSSARYFQPDLFGLYLEDLLEAETVKKFEKILNFEESDAKEILSAISWFHKAFVDTERYNTILFLWASLESLLGREQSKHKAKAVYNEIFAKEDGSLIDDAYEYRNMIHGADPRSCFIPSLYCKRLQWFVYRLIKKKMDDFHASN